MGAPRITDSEAVTVPAFFRPVDARKVVGLSRATMYAWAKAGHITLHKPSGATLIETAEVVKLIRAGGPPAKSSGGQDGG